MTFLSNRLSYSDLSKIAIISINNSIPSDSSWINIQSREPIHTHTSTHTHEHTHTHTHTHIHTEHRMNYSCMYTNPSSHFTRLGIRCPVFYGYIEVCTYIYMYVIILICNNIDLLISSSVSSSGLVLVMPSRWSRLS